MHYRTLLGALAAGCLIAAPAMAEPKFYASAYGGINQVADFDGTVPGFGTAKVEFDSGYNFDGALGVAVNRVVRLELNGGYVDSEVDKIKISGFTVASDLDASLYYGTANLVLDIPLGTEWVTPFISGGVGAARIRIDDEKDESIAVTGSAGLSIKISDGLYFEPGYRMLYVRATDENVYIHMGRFGLRLMFN